MPDSISQLRPQDKRRVERNLAALSG
jgi:hypothetical protein